MFRCKRQIINALKHAEGMSLRYGVIVLEDLIQSPSILDSATLHNLCPTIYPLIQKWCYVPKMCNFTRFWYIISCNFTHFWHLLVNLGGQGGVEVVIDFWGIFLWGVAEGVAFVKPL